MQGLIVRGEKLRLCPKSSGGHESVQWRVVRSLCRMAWLVGAIDTIIRQELMGLETGITEGV